LSIRLKKSGFTSSHRCPICLNGRGRKDNANANASSNRTRNTPCQTCLTAPVSFNFKSKGSVVGTQAQVQTQAHTQMERSDIPIGPTQEERHRDTNANASSNRTRNTPCQTCLTAPVSFNFKRGNRHSRQIQVAGGFPIQRIDGCGWHKVS
jgi:hypothetical protein